eukprot:364238-Chlamydomonas_euryale.AAC.1
MHACWRACSCSCMCEHAVKVCMCAHARVHARGHVREHDVCACVGAFSKTLYLRRDPRLTHPARHSRCRCARRRRHCELAPLLPLPPPAAPGARQYHRR